LVITFMFGPQRSWSYNRCGLNAAILSQGSIVLRDTND